MPEEALQILFGGRRPQQMGRGAKHYDDFWALHLVMAADVHISYDVEHHHLQGDWCWPGHPGPLVRFAPSGSMPQQHYRFALQGPLLRRWWREELWPRRPLAIRDRTAATACCEHILETCAGDAALDRRRRRHAVEGLLIELQHQQRHTQEERNWIGAVRRHLEEHCCEAIDYTALADRWLMPLSRLRRDFRRLVGMPLDEYRLRARCRLAQSLLLESDLCLAAIAERCGYTDQAYFARQFKRFTGYTPGSQRRARFA